MQKPNSQSEAGKFARNQRETDVRNPVWISKKRGLTSKVYTVDIEIDKVKLVHWISSSAAGVKRFRIQNFQPLMNEYIIFIRFNKNMLVRIYVVLQNKS